MMRSTNSMIRMLSLLMLGCLCSTYITRMKTWKSYRDRIIHISSKHHDDDVSNINNEDYNNRNRNKGSIYVLHLEDNNFYVGKTIRNVNTRIKEHLDNGYMTSRWTKQYKPLRRLAPLTSIPDDLESWERAETLERMWIYGIQRVRGWKYTQLNLTASDQSQVIMQLCERKDLCRSCGNFGHGISHCSAKKHSKAKWMKDIKKNGYLHPDYRGKIFERQFVNMLNRVNTNATTTTTAIAATRSKRDDPGYNSIDQSNNISGINQKDKRLLLPKNNATVDSYSNNNSDNIQQQLSSSSSSGGVGGSVGESYLPSIGKGPMSSSSSLSSSATTTRAVGLSTTPLQLSHRSKALLLQMAYAITTAWCSYIFYLPYNAASKVHRYSSVMVLTPLLVGMLEVQILPLLQQLFAGGRGRGGGSGRGGDGGRGVRRSITIAVAVGASLVGLMYQPRCLNMGIDALRLVSLSVVRYSMLMLSLRASHRRSRSRIDSDDDVDDDDDGIIIHGLAVDTSVNSDSDNDDDDQSNRSIIITTKTTTTTTAAASWWTSYPLISFYGHVACIICHLLRRNVL